MVRCSNNKCLNEGALQCARCKAAVYCSAQCQEQGWNLHKTYCGREAYTFEVTLMGSSKPVIKRTFDIPSWYNFKQLHYTIQYAMGWQGTHLHEFTFAAPSKYKMYPASDGVLKISMTNAYDDYFDLALKESEDKLLLVDVYDQAGRLRDIVCPSTEFYPLFYLYDFGDNWEHELVFKGSKPAQASRPIFISASGCNPLDDWGGIWGWDDIKAAFKARRLPEERMERISWARSVSGLGEEFDHSKEPDLLQMNQGWRENNPGGHM